jgi:stage II sporulation protein D
LATSDYPCEVWIKTELKPGIVTLTDGNQRTGMSIESILTGAMRKHIHAVFFRRKIIFLLLLAVLGGCKKRQITTPTPQIDIDSKYWIRILLFSDINSCTLKIPSSFCITSNEPNLQTEARSADLGPTDGPMDLQLVNGQITFAGRTFTDNPLIISPAEPYIFNLNGIDYRGKLKLIKSPDGGSFEAINLVPIESYLAGVAGAEMPDYWEPEALQAQVIAARTYCLYIKRRFGGNRDWDMKKTAAHQVYSGLSCESSAIWKAVNETSGMVLTCKQADSTEDIFPAYYSSTCGGHTENSKNVFGDSFEPLAGVPCPYCRDVAKPEFFFWPMLRYNKAEVRDKLFQRYEKLRNLGEITDITVAAQSDYGDFSRLTMMELHGSNGGKDFIRAEDFRLAIDPTGGKIKSASFQLADLQDGWAFLCGRGWGHGVGMCQCGAEGMARHGKTAGQILVYYYPGSKIITIDYK